MNNNHGEHAYICQWYIYIIYECAELLSFEIGQGILQMGNYG